MTIENYINYVYGYVFKPRKTCKSMNYFDISWELHFFKFEISVSLLSIILSLFITASSMSALFFLRELILFS